MDIIDCKLRVNAYFNNMNLYPNNNRMRVRFLHKIFKAALDKNYTFQEHEMVLKMLLDDANNTKDEDYKFLDLLFCYKIKKAIGSDIEVPIIKSEKVVKGVDYEYREAPEAIKKQLIERNNKLTLAFMEAAKPDEEALELYNVYISQDHFYYKGD